MADDALFPELPARAPAPAARPATPGARRRARQAIAVRHHRHPLSVALGYDIRLHPDATTDDGPTCGGCRFRRAPGGTARAYPKCLAGGDKWPRATHGPGTDVLASWPACVDYQPKEENR